MKEFLKKILPAPCIRAGKKILLLFPQKRYSVSMGHHIIKNPDLKALKKEFDDAWKNTSIPEKQMALSTKQIPHYEEVAPMKALVDILKGLGDHEQSILEIGCSTGYYSEVFSRAGLKLHYEGCDYSPSFIEKARQCYPDLTFAVADSRKLPYASKAFDIALSGCCILHIIEYKEAIEETARVAKTIAIFHRTPVIHSNKTLVVKKMGYGVPMIEICFNEEELFHLFRLNGLSVVDVKIIGQSSLEGLDEPVFSKTYLCRTS